MLLDGTEFAVRWLETIGPVLSQKKTSSGTEAAGTDEEDTTESLKSIREALAKGEDLRLRAMPKDLLQTLTDMVLGSPAVCIWRALEGCIPAAQGPEAEERSGTILRATVDLAYCFRIFHGAVL